MLKNCIELYILITTSTINPVKSQWLFISLSSRGLIPVNPYNAK